MAISNRSSNIISKISMQGVTHFIRFVQDNPAISIVIGIGVCYCLVLASRQKSVMRKRIDYPVGAMAWEGRPEYETVVSDKLREDIIAIHNTFLQKQLTRLDRIAAYKENSFILEDVFLYKANLVIEKIEALIFGGGSLTTLQLKNVQCTWADSQLFSHLVALLRIFNYEITQYSQSGEVSKDQWWITLIASRSELISDNRNGEAYPAVK